MVGFLGTKEEAKLAKLIDEEERAKVAKTGDRFNLPPVAKGFVRGYAIKVRSSEEPCEFATMQVLEFEVSDTMRGPGVPVRMVGTYFNSRLQEGVVLDVPDPTPTTRPITPEVVFRAQRPDQKRGQNPDHYELRAFYPGRSKTRPRISLLARSLSVAGPAVIVIAIIVLLWIFVLQR